MTTADAAPTGAPPTMGPIDPTKFNPNDPAFIADPYPTLAWFRENIPVAQISLVPGMVPPSYWVFRDADVRTVLETTDVFLKHANGPGAPPPPPIPPVFGTLGALPPGLLSSDPPRHTTLRAAMQPLFTKSIAQASAIAQTAVDQVLAGLAQTRQFELLNDFATPVPSLVLAQILGLPTTDLTVLRNWVSSIATAHNITQPPALLAYGGTCAMSMRTYYDGLVVENGQQPAGGLLTLMCGQLGSGIDLHDLQAVMSDLLVAGYLTTTYLISTGIRSLLDNPDQLQKLRTKPALITTAIEEMLRFDPPAQMLDRQVAKAVTLGGVAMQPGTRVVVSVASANRDPAAFTNPDVFDITRTDTTQLGFGDGIHYCIGAPLARIVAPAAITGLLKLDGLRINGDPQWQPDPYLRGLTSLPMAYDS